MDEITISWGSEGTYTAFRFGSKDPQRQRDGVASWSFFQYLPKHLKNADVDFGPNPPDFVIQSGNIKIGVELTQLSPTTTSRKGYTVRGTHKEWITKPPPDDGTKAEFNWGIYSLGESLEALKRQVSRKDSDAGRYCATYDELWLLLQCQEGSPFGTLAESIHKKPGVFSEKGLDFAAKEAFEVERILSTTTRFRRVILFSGGGFVSVRSGTSAVNLPELDPDLLSRGSSLDDSFLNWKRSLKSLRWRSAT